MAPGCGDNVRKGIGQGGMGGSVGDGGAGTGAAGTDGGRDGDAAMDGVDAETGGDADARPDGDAGDVMEVGPDAMEVGPEAGPDATDGPEGGAAGADGGAGTGGAGSGGAGTGGAGTGGAGTGGAGTGGAGTGGAGTGGAGTGGAGIGGAGTGGAGTGGAGTGGAGTGGAGTGGAGTGGAGTGGADGGADASDGGDAGMDVSPELPPPACFTVSFVKPVDLQQLSAANDQDADNCANGFQFDVEINTNAPNGADVQLFGGAVLLKTAQASGGKAVFTGVQFASSGDTQLSIQFPDTAPCTDPAAKAKVTVDCSVPSCSITKPVISGSHPALNGVPSTQGGDRVSATGSPYQAAFEITTDIANNQTVALDINNAATPAVVTTVTALASGGKATFAGVALPPGATYEVQARCIAGSGVVGRSAKGSYPVDATEPDLTISRPSSGDFIGPGGLTAGAFPVCGKTTSTDAVNLDAALGLRVSNYCVQTSGSPLCVAATAVGVDTCINVPCPGDAPFDITVTLTDAAGNPQTRTINGVTCSSSTPTVEIISPVTDAPLFNDPSRHLLAANAAQPFRDQNGAVAGAQADVIACTSRGGTATLFSGHVGDPALAPVGGTVVTAAATALDGCPSGLGFVARFLGVTLPESVENPATGALNSATRLRVDLADVSASTGQSAPLDLWVDTLGPTISLTFPAGLCGSFQQAFATYDTDVIFATDTPDVTMTITNAGSTQTLSSPTLTAGSAKFTAAAFPQGQSNMAAVAKDPAGNATAMAPVPCTVTAGMAPVVIFTNPTSTNRLCPSVGGAGNCIDDADVNQSGWQGSLTVQALANGMPVTSGMISFSVGGVSLGTAALDGSGNATLNNVTLFDGAVTISAQTDNIPGHGVGTGQVTVIVDLGAPDAPTNLMATVHDRRETSFDLSWNAPSDVGARVAGYQVKYATVPITSANFDDAAVTSAMTYSGMPSAVGDTDGILVTPLNIETDYYFAVAAVDAAGNRSGIAATTAPVRGEFKTIVLSGVGTDNAGYDINGSGDFGTDGTRGFAEDGFSDLIVGATGGTHVYLYFGSKTGYSAASSITFTGSATGFGRAVANVGDIDADGLDDIAIASPADNGGRVYIFSRKNPPASWGSMVTAWPAALSDTQANYVISTSGALSGAMFNRGLTRLGHFDDDDNDDFAIGFPLANSNVGAVVVVKGGPTFASRTLPDAVNTIQISGTVAAGGFGVTVVGLGPFYNGVGQGATLVASASIVGTSYAFAGQSPGSGVLSVTGADDTIVGPAADRYGTPLGFLGRLGPSPGALAVAALNGKYVDLHLGTAATGPFLTSGTTPAPSARFVNPDAGNSFGVINIGGGVRGTSQSVSFIGGDDVPDLVLAGQGQTGNRIYLVNGSLLSTLSGTVNVTTPRSGNVPGIVSMADKLPADWANGYTTGCVIVDMDKDTHGDFAIGEFSSARPGRVVVFY